MEVWKVTIRFIQPINIEYMKQILLTMLTALMMSLSCANVQGQTFSKIPEKQRNAAIIKAAKDLYNNPVFKNHRKNWPYIGKPTITEFITNDTVTRMTANHNIGKLQYIVHFWSKDKYHGKPLKATEVFVSDKLGKAWYCQFGDNYVWTLWNIYLLEKWNKKKK